MVDLSYYWPIILAIILNGHAVIVFNLYAKNLTVFCLNHTTQPI
jgi:hypothetical protein